MAEVLEVRVGGKRVRALLLQKNKKSAWVRLPNGDTIRRKAGRDYDPESLASVQEGEVFAAPPETRFSTRPSPRYNGPPSLGAALAALFMGGRSRARQRRAMARKKSRS